MLLLKNGATSSRQLIKKINEQSTPKTKLTLTRNRKNRYTEHPDTYSCDKEIWKSADQ